MPPPEARRKRHCSAAHNDIAATGTCIANELLMQPFRTKVKSNRVALFKSLQAVQKLYIILAEVLFTLR